MIKNLITKIISPSEIAKTIKSLDMTSEIKKLISQVMATPDFAAGKTLRAAVIAITNPHTGTVILHRTSIGNISIRSAPFNSGSSSLYSVPGQSILFALDQPFEIQQYTLDEQCIRKTERIIIDKRNPLVIDGRHMLFDYLQTGSKTAKLTGRIDLPNRAVDIGVYDRVTLRKTAWLPHDKSAACYLTSLDLLETIQDPDGGKVAEELIYHYHPAVVWKAFQILYQTEPQKALTYVPLLKKHKNERLDSLLLLLEAAA